MDLYVKTSEPNYDFWDGTWEEFRENMILNDIPIQMKAAKEGLAPMIHKVEFDEDNQTYTITMEKIDGITLFDHIESRKETMLLI